MILIACLDDKNGMMFNKRRQSKDACVRADIVSEVGSGLLWMNAYSEKQFAEDGNVIPGICADEAFMKKAAAGDYCFAEGAGAASVEEKIEKIIIYKWNRLYPADVRFDIDLTGWKLVQTSEFAGKSHEKITKEVYSK